MADDDALAALTKHNEELSRLVSNEGRIAEAALLELIVHSQITKHLSRYENLLSEDEERLRAVLTDDFQTHLQGIDPRQAEILAADVIVYLAMPGAVKDLIKKIGSVINSYVKKTAGGVLGGDSDDQDDP
ncbi:hypothetical protein [Salipiger thiooxidans]|uniref:hypothetical protein n=1 Tax=Salipiger thiooxidans TaxID=282683 RepID=UPI001CFAE4E6|nr:hypothetical protein [Salipiger thiooxidans]